MTDVARCEIFGSAAGTPADKARTAKVAQAAVRDPADVDLFVKLSAAISGIAEEKLALRLADFVA